MVALLLAGCVLGGAIAAPGYAAQANGYRDAHGKWHALPSDRAAQPDSGDALPAPVASTPPPVAPAGASYPAPKPGMPIAVSTQSAGAPQDARGPQGSSQLAPGEERYDKTGYAAVLPATPDGGPARAVAVTLADLAPGSFVEVTSLDTGHTILALVTGTSDGGAIGLSPEAGRLLGVDGDRAAVRLRKVMPPAEDQAALTAGRAAAARIDAPQILLTALRRRLPAAPAVARAPIAAAPAAPARPAPAPAASVRRAGYFVQVAALSNARNADALARQFGGFVRAGGGLYRVQMGPFPDPAGAERARAKAVAHGYGDARIFAQN